MDNSQKKFVIQQHTTPDGVHWDLMLKKDDCLWTWRLNVPPNQIKDQSITAERIADHPLQFLTYEGPVQNGTGNVKIADKGTYTQHVIPTETLRSGAEQCAAEEPVKTTPRNGSPLKQNQPDCLTLNLQGALLKGTFTLTRTPNTPLWTLKRQSDSN
jgi:hypothetical protein